MGDENGWTSAQGPNFAKSYQVLIDAYEEVGYPLPEVLVQFRDNPSLAYDVIGNVTNL